MLSKVPSWVFIIVIFLCLVTIVLIFSYHRVHAQDKPDDFHFEVLKTDENGDRKWIGIVPKSDLKLYCFDGDEYSPCQMIDDEDHKNVLFLGPVPTDEPSKEPPAGKERLQRAER